MHRIIQLLLAVALAACGDPAETNEGSPTEAGSSAGSGDVNQATPAAPKPPPEPEDPRLDESLQRIAMGEFAIARKLAGTVQSERPGSARAAFLLALAYHKEKNYGAALPEFDRAIELGPTFEPFAPVHYFRGWCLYNLGATGEARAAFERHLELVPKEGDSHFALGLIALDENRLDDAERELRAAFADAEGRVRAGDRSRMADAAKARARLADVFLARADRPRREAVEAARAELEAALDLYPPHYNAWYKLYTVLIELGEEALAAQALAQHDQWKARVRPGSKGLGDR